MGDLFLDNAAQSASPSIVKPPKEEPRPEPDSAALKVYEGSNGDVTKAYYETLLTRGHIGKVAMNLFRAHKASGRAKEYSRRFRGAAYDKKSWSLGLLIDALLEDPCGLTFGWGHDAASVNFEWVFYIDLPHGQVSFHAPTRGRGPDYAGGWDGQRGWGKWRVCRFCDDVMKAPRR